MRTTLFFLLLLGSSPLRGVVAHQNDYGVDVSWPIHHAKVSANYAWLPHNVDPVNNPTPSQYEDMPIQPLGDRQKFYNDFLEGCRNFYGRRGSMCDTTEYDRIAMSIRQPQSMQVRDGFDGVLSVVPGHGRLFSNLQLTSSPATFCLQRTIPTWGLRRSEPLTSCSSS